MYNARTFFTILALCLPLVVSNAPKKCAFSKTEKYWQVICKNVTVEDYVRDAVIIKSIIVNSPSEPLVRHIDPSLPYIEIPPLELEHNIRLDVSDSYLPTLGDWFLLPWDSPHFFVDSIRVVNSSVTNIELFHTYTSVHTLDLSRNHITDYRFLKNLRLNHLKLSYSNFTEDSYLFTFLKLNTRVPIDTVDLSHTNLERFTIQNSHVSVFDLSYCANLTVIELENTYWMPTLILNGNRDVTFQSIRNKSCISLEYSASGQDTFDLTRLGNVYIVRSISLRDNNLGQLNESVFQLKMRCVLFPGRISVDLSRSNLSELGIDVFSFHILDVLNLSNNNLSSLKGTVFGQADILTLDLSGNSLSTIEPSALSSLRVGEMNLSRNQLTSVNGVFRLAEEVNNLDLSNNLIETVQDDDFKGCRNLERLQLANNFLKALSENTFASMASLKSLTLSVAESTQANRIKSIYLTELVLVNSTIKELRSELFEGFVRLRKLTFRNTSIETVDHEAFGTLANLRRINNLKESIGDGRLHLDLFKSLSSLDVLDLSGQDLKKLNVDDLAGLIALRKLNLSSNSLSAVDVDSFVATKRLETLSLADNQLANLAVGTFRQLRNLTHLYLNKNRLQQLSPGLFSGLNELVLLDLSENELVRSKPQLTIATSMPKLTRLRLQHNALGNEYSKGDELLRKNEFALIARHGALKHVDINDNGWKCATLIEVLLVLRGSDIGYVPSQPDYTVTNINGVSCTY